MDIQQGDVRIFQTDDGGDISIVNGKAEMDGGLESMAYLCLFGGNEDDDGIDGNLSTWWGNMVETQKSKQYRSETQYLLRNIPLTSSNLRRIEEAAKRDLAVMVTEGVASEVDAVATIPGVNQLAVTVSINAEGTPEEFTFYENWVYSA